MTAEKPLLLLLFEGGSGRFALDARKVVKVIPLVQQKKIPTMPDYVAGVINYHGKPVPVVDLCILTDGVPCRVVYSTRIILVNYPLSSGKEILVGLIAEKVTDVIRSKYTDSRKSGVLIDEALNIHILQPGSDEMVHWFDIEQMIPGETIIRLSRL